MGALPDGLRRGQVCPLPPKVTSPSLQLQKQRCTTICLLPQVSLARFILLELLISSTFSHTENT